MVTPQLKALAKRTPFRMVTHMNCDTVHYFGYANAELGVACTIETPYKHGRPGKGVKTFTVDRREDKGFKTLAALYAKNPDIAKAARKLYPAK